METTLNIEVITETFEQIIYFGYFLKKTQFDIRIKVMHVLTV